MMEIGSGTLNQLLEYLRRDNREIILKSEERWKLNGMVDPFSGGEQGSFVFAKGGQLSARMLTDCGIVLPLFVERPQIASSDVGKFVNGLDYVNQTRRSAWASFIKEENVPVYLDYRSGSVSALRDRAIEAIETMFFTFICSRLQWLHQSSWRMGNRVSSNWLGNVKYFMNEFENLLASYGGCQIVNKTHFGLGHANIQIVDTLNSIWGRLMYNDTYTLPAIFGYGIQISISQFKVSVTYMGKKVRKYLWCWSDNFSTDRGSVIKNWDASATAVDFLKFSSRVNGGSNYFQPNNDLVMTHSHLLTPVAFKNINKPTVEESEGNSCFPTYLLGYTYLPASFVHGMDLGRLISFNSATGHLRLSNSLNASIIDMDAMVRSVSSPSEEIPDEAGSLGMVAVASQPGCKMSAKLKNTAIYRLMDKADRKKEFLKTEYAKGKKFSSMDTSFTSFLKEGLRQLCCLPISAYVGPLMGSVYPYHLIISKCGPSEFEYRFNKDGSDIVNSEHMLLEFFSHYNAGASVTYSLDGDASNMSGKECLSKLAHHFGVVLDYPDVPHYPDMSKESAMMYSALNQWYSLLYFNMGGSGLDTISFAYDEVKLSTASGLDINTELLIESVMRYGLYDSKQRGAKHRTVRS